MDRWGNPYGAASLRWDMPQAENVFAYTDLAAFKRGEPSFHRSADIVHLDLSDDKQGYVVRAATSRALALVTGAPDAAAATLDWEVFKVSDATVRNFAELEGRLLTTPLRELLNTRRVVPRPIAEPHIFDPSLPILNLEQFDSPPLCGIAARFGCKFKPVDFLETIAEPTTRVSRAPAWLDKFKFQALESETKDELFESLPEVVNHVKDPAVMQWLLGQIENAPELKDWAFCGKRQLPMTNREYIEARVTEIQSAAQREMIRTAIGPPDFAIWEMEP